jgi:hypothetical protein
MDQTTHLCKSIENTSNNLSMQCNFTQTWNQNNQQSYNLNGLAKYSLFILISTQSFTIFCKHDQTPNSNFLFSNNIKLQKCYKVSTSRITLKLNKLNLLISINHEVYNRTIEPCFFIPTNTQSNIDSLAFISISNLYSYFTCSLDTYVLANLCYL